MKILLAPLNWGLGHAARCIPIIHRFLAEGHDVVLAGDGASLTLLSRHFPELRTIPLPHLQLTYSKSHSQTGAILRALPHIVRWAIADHHALQQLLALENFDMVISDNRFCFYTTHTRSVYITHQLLIPLPRPWQWLQPLLHRLHLSLIRHYTECWIPDNANPPHLSGNLAHRYPLPCNARFIGPLSRFPVAVCSTPPAGTYHTVAVLSGLEPQRTLLEQALIDEYTQKDETLLIVRGKVNDPYCRIKKGNITLVPYLSDSLLQHHLLAARHIIARSGYSTIMDLHALNVLSRATLIPTPGQPEQEYLAKWLCASKSKA